MTVAELKKALSMLPSQMDAQQVVIALGVAESQVHCGPVTQIVVAQPGVVLFPFPFPPPGGAVGSGMLPEDPADWWKKG
jgi:hypothetical protein